MLPLKYLQTDKEIRIRTFTVILISSITKAYFIRPSISPTWILQKLVHVRSNRCTFLWVVNASLPARSSGSEGSLLKSWHFSESIQIKFLKKTFHTFSLKNSPRSSPSQYFLLKHFLIDYNMLSTVTPPNALTLVTFSQHPELAKKMLALPVFSWEEIWGIYLVLPSSVMFLEPFLPLLMLWQHHQMVPWSCPGGPGEGAAWGLNQVLWIRNRIFCRWFTFIFSCLCLPWSHFCDETVFSPSASKQNQTDLWKMLKDHHGIHVSLHWCDCVVPRAWVAPAAQVHVADLQLLLVLHRATDISVLKCDHSSPRPCLPFPVWFPEQLPSGLLCVPLFFQAGVGISFPSKANKSK